MAQEINLDGRSILISGGTGSFGQAFVDYVLANYKPRRLIVFSRDETKQHEMALRLDASKHPCLRFFIGDIRDLGRLEMAMRDVEIVVHAAALKIVPVAEYNPFECIATNIYGSENIIRAAIRNNVSKVLALSTDKAVNPANHYGATKLAAEKLFVAANNLSGDKGTRFVVTRYGNVVGSRGSVVPLYARLIKEGAKDLPITDERMTRFWITITQGVQFVLTSLEMMNGAEIFIPKLQSTLMTDVVKAMAPNLPTRIIGIRPGEKLHELLISQDDLRSTFELEDRYIIRPELIFWHSADVPMLGDRLVDENFQYVSNNESLLMPIAGLRKLLTLTGFLEG